MSIDKVSQKVANFINNSKGTQRVLTGIGKNPAIFSAEKVSRPESSGLYNR